VITRLLVANRGEIARRVIRTCRTLGISPVAVHSDVDAAAAHVREADLAVRLPGASPAETYLRSELLVSAALRTGADAIHPGYGFLSEDAGFAQAVLAAGLVWVGPPPAAIAAMGSKVDAKRMVALAGVPVLPTWSPGDVPAHAVFPLLVKASYGGGGRGMRVVRGRSGLDGAVTAARREAESAFGDGTVFVEPYLPAARHVEVQVLADTRGTVLALGDRECSVQRRHQKIVEEAPAPGLAPALRARLADAAVAVARSIDYVGAGTVEFLLSPDGEPAFLEVNTRLQVEHPVTEAVLGLDLVALQLAVAEGRPLPFTAPPPARGHAIEVRLYAEDPAAGWLPATGTLHRLAVPGATEFAGRGLRLDSGVLDGDEVSPHYDPMLAKLIGWAPDRPAAARRLADALARSSVHGPATNRDLLVRLLRHPAFLAGGVDTGFLPAHPELLAPLAGTAEVGAAALAAALAAAARRQASAAVLSTLPAGWRNLRSAPASAGYQGPDGPVQVAYRPLPAGVTLLEAAPDRVVLDRDGVRTGYAVHAVGAVSYVDGPEWMVRLSEVDPLPAPVAALPAGSLTAPMPGSVLAVRVAKGDRVAAGQPVLVLEAMKMEHTLAAPAAGTVTEVRVAAGEQVPAGAVLAVLEPEETD
jgi:propionyl-CoA carboxylase alpha chain